jgi:transposase
VELPVAVVNLRQVREFGMASGTLAKTDELDRHVIAHFAEAVQPPVRTLKDPQARELSALIAQRRQLVEMLTSENNRLASADAPLRKGMNHITSLAQRSKDTHEDLCRSIHASPPKRANRTKSCKASLGLARCFRRACSPMCPNSAG